MPNANYALRGILGKRWITDVLVPQYYQHMNLFTNSVIRDYACRARNIK